MKLQCCLRSFEPTFRNKYGTLVASSSVISSTRKTSSYRLYQIAKVIPFPASYWKYAFRLPTVQLKSTGFPLWWVLDLGMTDSNSVIGTTMSVFVVIE
ncbi:unnamed protein product, partial [Dicrocoelium dendriticum]